MDDRRPLHQRLAEQRQLQAEREDHEARHATQLSTTLRDDDLEHLRLLQEQEEMARQHIRQQEAAAFAALHAAQKEKRSQEPTFKLQDEPPASPTTAGKASLQRSILSAAIRPKPKT